uniref:Uncharacterized protein n=1 Tax=Periophthalmus magnuspinnatus TaxID=409849 RepID=A0A3B4A9G5_9GOBI
MVSCKFGQCSAHKFPIRQMYWIFMCDVCALFCRLTFPRGHFPKLAECAHFHYETVDFGTAQV